MSSRFIRQAIVLGATTCLLGQCRKPEAVAPVQSQSSLALVAGQPVTEQDLLHEIEWRKANHQEVPATPEVLKEIVNRLALAEKAKQAGVLDDPETKRRIQSLLIARLREKDLDARLAKITVTDEDLTKAYEARRAEFARKGLDRFSILFQAADEKMSEARRAESRQRIEEGIAKSDANPAPGGRGPAASGFGTVASEFSEDQTSRYRGGDIGWIQTDLKESRWPASVLEAGRALEKGKRSAVIETPEGFYVIMKTDSRPGGERPLEEVGEGLRQQILRDRKRALEESFVADALKLSKAEIHTDAVANVKLPVPSPVKSVDGPPPSPR